VIHFKGEPADHSSTVEVTYHINVGRPAHIVPPHKSFHGKDYSEWSASWWQWDLEHPLAGHPNVDGPGFDVRSGQHGNVWFLAAPFPGTYERSVTIAAGKALFFALLSAEVSNAPAVGQGRTHDSLRRQLTFQCRRTWS